MDDDVEGGTGNHPTFGGATDKADAAEQVQLITEATIGTVEFGETEEYLVGDIAGRTEIHDGAEADLGFFGIAFAEGENTHEEFGAGHVFAILGAAEFLEKFEGVAVHLLFEIAFANAETGIVGGGGFGILILQRGKLGAGEVEALGLVVESAELVLGEGLLFGGDGGDGVVGDEPAAEVGLGFLARGIVLEEGETIGDVADVVHGDVIEVLGEESFVNRVGFPSGVEFTVAETLGGDEEDGVGNGGINDDGAETEGGVFVEGEQELAALGAGLFIDTLEVRIGLEQNHAGELGFLVVGQLAGEGGEFIEAAGVGGAEGSHEAI